MLIVLNFKDVSINTFTGIFLSISVLMNMLNIFNDIYYKQKIYSEFYHIPINNITILTMTKVTLENNHEFWNDNIVISHIIKQVSNKKIQISFRQLLKIVKSEIQQDIINSIANPDISQRNRTLCKVKRKEIFKWYSIWVLIWILIFIWV